MLKILQTLIGFARCMADSTAAASNSADVGATEEKSLGKCSYRDVLNLQNALSVRLKQVS